MERPLRECFFCSFLLSFCSSIVHLKIGISFADIVPLRPEIFFLKAQICKGRPFGEKFLEPSKNCFKWTDDRMKKNQLTPPPPPAPRVITICDR